jgi:hypothetical protein
MNKFEISKRLDGKRNVWQWTEGAFTPYWNLVAVCGNFREASQFIQDQMK